MMKIKNHLQTGIVRVVKEDGSRLEVPLFSENLLTEVNQLKEELNCEIEGVWEAVPIYDPIANYPVEVIKHYLEKDEFLYEYWMDELRSGIRGYAVNALSIPYYIYA